MTKSFRPMLSGKAPEDLSLLNYPVLASPKIDGIRCLIIDGVAMSRSLKPIPNLHIQRKLGGIEELNGLDGELMLRDCVDFNDSQSGIMSKEGKPNFMYHVFDHTDCHGADFGQRLHHVDELCERLQRNGCDYIEVVPHESMTCKSQMEEYHENMMEMGYEGTMVRDPEGPYKFGRSTDKQGWLLKVKPFDDAEATVIGFVEQMENTNEKTTDNLGNSKRSSHKAGMVPKGTLGKIVCMNNEGEEVTIGTGLGLTNELRQEIWDNQDVYLGSLVKYKCQRPAKGSKKVAPRIPIFLGFRHEDDTSK